MLNLCSDCLSYCACGKISSYDITKTYQKGYTTMTYEEASNFTYEELSNFTYLELSLEKSELLQKLINDNCKDISSSVLDKLQKLCQNFMTSCDKYNIDIPKEIQPIKNKKSLSIMDIFAIIGIIVEMLTLAYNIYSASNAQTVNNIYINQTINYIQQNDYINDIDIIINELTH